MSNDKKPPALAWVLAFALSLAALAGKVYAVWLIWHWHLVPLGAPQIELWRVVGLGAFAVLVMWRVPDQEDARAKDRRSAYDKWLDVASTSFAWLLVRRRVIPFRRKDV